MLKKYVKKILLLCIMIIMLLSINNYIYAGEATDMKSLISTLDAGNPEDATADKVDDVVSIVITIARVVGVTVAIVMLLVVAMKYMTAAPGEKADIKKSAVVYVVGAIVLFAVTGILGIINTFASNIKYSGT